MKTFATMKGRLKAVCDTASFVRGDRSCWFETTTSSDTGPNAGSDQNGKFLKQWTHLGATQGMFITPKDGMWIITHRDKIENLTHDTGAGRIMRIDIATGKIRGAMERLRH